MALTKVSTGVVDMSGNTGGLVIAKGTEIQRPASPSIGMIRESTETIPGKVEVYTDNSGAPGWQFLEEVGPTTIVPLTVDYLVVAGGGGGGGLGGGGGAGGLLSSFGSSGRNTAALNSETPSTGTNINITIGTGGSYGSYSPSITAGNGSNSVIGFTTPVTAYGGGGGSSYNRTMGNGGSGGGGSHIYYPTGGSGTAGQGYNGGNAETGQPWSAGGGGGAGQLGGNYSGATGGAGGDGMQNDITVATAGTGPYYGGGGGGGGYSSEGAGVAPGGAGNSTGTGANSNYGGPGTNNFGGGGGGGGYSGSTPSRGGIGGSGVVIFRYPSAYAITFQTGVGFISSTAPLSATSEKVTTITAGSGTITFALTP